MGNMNIDAGKGITTEKEIIRYRAGETEKLSDIVVCESWLDLYVNETLILETPVSGKELEELIHGFLFMEGYIGMGERLEIRRDGDRYFVGLDREVKAVRIRDLVDCAASRVDFGEEIEPLAPAGSTAPRTLAPEEILRLAADFQRLPSVYHETGGVHMAAFARDRILHSADDISRRNAVDKALGKAFLAGESFGEGLLLLSGRISSDIVVRMLRVGIPLVVSKSAPTDRAVELAEAYGLTLCGFARGKRVNIYTHPERVGLDSRGDIVL